MNNLSFSLILHGTKRPVSLRICLEHRLLIPLAVPVVSSHVFAEILLAPLCHRAASISTITVIVSIFFCLTGSFHCGQCF